MSNVHDLFPSDEQAQLAGEAFRKLARSMREKGFDSDSVTSALLGAALEEMLERDGPDDTANWLLGIYGRLSGVPTEGKSH